MSIKIKFEDDGRLVHAPPSYGSAMPDPVPLAALREALSDVPGLELLVLYGSRARGNARSGSDWDFGYLGKIDSPSVYDRIARVLGTNDVDLVDLTTASGLLRFQAARDGMPIAEKTSRLFDEFAITAALHWFDVEPIVRRANDDLFGPLMERAVFAERVAVVNRHLRRVEDRLPPDENDLKPMSDATDAVILQLWQSVQLVIDIATALCVKRGLGVPPTYGDAFLLLARDGVIPEPVAESLARCWFSEPHRSRICRSRLSPHPPGSNDRSCTTT